MNKTSMNKTSMNKTLLLWVAVAVGLAAVLFVVLYFVFGLRPGEAGGASAAVGATLVVAAKRRQEAEDKARAMQEALAKASQQAFLRSVVVQEEVDDAPTVVGTLTADQKVRLGNDLFNPQGGKKS